MVLGPMALQERDCPHCSRLSDRILVHLQVGHESRIFVENGTRRCRYVLPWFAATVHLTISCNKGELTVRLI